MRTKISQKDDFFVLNLRWPNVIQKNQIKHKLCCDVKRKRRNKPYLDIRLTGFILHWC